MREYDEDFENKKITITRREFGELVAREVHDLMQASKKGDDPVFGFLMTELMITFGASLMHEMFGDDELEVQIDE